ncbi:unnamed protein product [Agarophyton chilense]|eukprot:gb/GEZJ01001479.1/.p1 GENE.gb/GEZJ01001479.1/~~gb/GEZJ01001479.1/.p1  ORF type:complete len:314 (+),score=41.41 gb/GEZJ01001479.1/:43-942(+)
MAAFIAPVLPSFRVRSLRPPHLVESCPKAVRNARKCAVLSLHQSPSSPPNVSSLVQTILQNAAASDSGAEMTAEKRRTVDDAIKTLNQIGRYRPNCLDDARIFANYSVVYTSSAEKSPPTGGNFRTSFARRLLPTTGLFQHIIAPNIVVNMVCFKILGLIDACVVLKGVLAKESEQSNMVGVQFEPPRIKVMDAVFEFGSTSSVRLATPYLDDSVRLGVGSRGSLFVFAKDQNANSAQAQQWKNIFKAKPLPAYVLLVVPLLIIAAMWFGGWPTRVCALLGILAMYFLRGRESAQLKAT